MISPKKKVIRLLFLVFIGSSVSEVFSERHGFFIDWVLNGFFHARAVKPLVDTLSILHNVPALFLLKLAHFCGNC